MSVNTYDVLNSTEELRILTNQWNTQNKSRVHLMHKCNTSGTTNTPVPLVIPAVPTITHPKVIEGNVGKKNPYMLASMRQVMESRQDLLGEKDMTGPQSVAKPATMNNIPGAAKLHMDAVVRPDMPTLKQYTDNMANIENRLLAGILGTLSAATLPYSCSIAEPHHEPTRSGIDALVHRNDIVVQACFAHIQPVGSTVPLQIYLPIPPPSMQQISKCAEDSSYNKNVVTNIAEALSREHTSVVLCSGPPKTRSKGTVYIDTEKAVNALGTAECCEDLLFGKTRTTSSPAFCVGPDISSVYAHAVHKYQKYSNVAIGAHITLVPSSRKRTMQVVSMACPQLGISHIVTDTSSTRIHPKFGPNHTTRSVEVMAKLAPFIKTCSESYMSIPTETVHELQEDGTMPTPESTNIEHCFAHNTSHGVSAYIGTHTFSLDTGILNTYTTKTTFPVKHHITVNIAAIFGTVTTGHT